MRSFVLVALVLAALATVLTGRAVVGPAHATHAQAPPGLTRYGHNIWELEALLRGVFGTKPLYIDHGTSGRAANFTTRFHANYRSGYYLYTFARADGSSFVLRRPARPPKANIGASGGEVPLTIQGAYISCTPGRWLFEHLGNGPANWQVGCHK